MNQIDTMKLALDFAIMHHTDAGYTEVRYAVQAALREALAEQPPVQEPVAWIHVDPCLPSVMNLEWKKAAPGYVGEWLKYPLYTSPQFAAAPQPAQRTPLTPAEVHGMAEAHGIDGDARHWYVVGLVDAQAKHNIKEQP